MEGLVRIAMTVTTLLCGRADPRQAAADVLRPPPARAAAGAPWQRGAGGPALAPTRRQQAAAQDAWFGEDKLRHFAMSFATATLTYASLRTAGAHDAALPGAIAVAAAAGLGKEVHDRRAGRIFSLRDLAWDALGVAAGYAFLRQIE